MIIDMHRHLVVKGTVQGAYIQGAAKRLDIEPRVRRQHLGARGPIPMPRSGPNTGAPPIAPLF